MLLQEPDLDPVEKYLSRFRPVIERCARRYASMDVGMEFDDLFSVGQRSVMLTLRGVAPGVPRADLDTCIRCRIRWAIIDEVRRFMPILRSTAAMRNIYREIVDGLQVELARQPTDNEIARRLNVSLLELEKMRQSFKPGGIVVRDNVVRDDYTGDLIGHVAGLDAVADTSGGPTDITNKEMLYACVEKLMRDLPDRERRVVRMSLLEDRTLEHIAVEMGLTKGRISQIRTGVLACLRRNMQSKFGILSAD